MMKIAAKTEMEASRSAFRPARSISGARSFGVPKTEQQGQAVFCGPLCSVNLVDLPLQAKPEPNRTGMSDQLKGGIEALSGMDISDVRVHLNSDKPAQVNALAYAQGSNIHLAPRQEQYLPHEVWHIVQQKLGRVRPTLHAKGIGINDDPRLEQEADLMGRKAKGFDTDGIFQENKSFNPLASIAPKQVTTRQVAQLCCGHPDCKDPKCTNPKNHVYRQDKDPSLIPFLRKGQHLIGQKAIEKQERGEIPLAEDVRVDAVKYGFQRAAAGLHEIIPTDQRSKVTARRNATVRGIQGGGRISTSLAILAPGIGHTQQFPKSGGRGSTNTSGQKKAHDRLRVLPVGQKPEEMIVDAQIRSISSLATGPQILSSPGLTGAVPNVLGMQPMGPPPANPKLQPDSTRISVASAHHERREHSKRRVNDYSKMAGLSRMTSPPREPIDKTGHGGGYEPPSKKPRPATPPPTFEGKTGTTEYAAHASSWLSAPLRFGYDSQTNTKVCRKCNTKNSRDASFCESCLQPL